MAEKRNDLTIGTQIENRSDPQIVTISTTGSGRLRVVLRGHGVLFDGNVDDPRRP